MMHEFPVIPALLLCNDEEQKKNQKYSIQQRYCRGQIEVGTDLQLKFVHTTLMKLKHSFVTGLVRQKV